METLRFMFAVGIECSCPLIAGNQRVDQLRDTGHYEMWQTDLRLVRELGLRYLRYGPPIYRIFKGRGEYDWSSLDPVMAEMRRLGVIPIIDLVHFGLPDWLGNFQNHEWPDYFADYAMRAILDLRPDAIFIYSESTEYVHPGSPQMVAQAHFMNERRFLALDLLFAHDVSATIYRYLLANGMTADEYLWYFNQRDLRRHCIMGTDYYITNEHVVRADGTAIGAGDVYGYYVITRQYFDRYRLPVMHTETNRVDKHAVEWLWKEWMNLLRLREDGVPIIGFTWFGLVDMKDWDTALTKMRGVVNRVGLYTLERKQRKVAREYRRLVQEYSQLPISSSKFPILTA
jgi:beta-glucosidase/6-phospho-beta-glucosidase/beta-galactosidase